MPVWASTRTRTTIGVYQDPNNPVRLINHDNDYLHYQDDWYIVDYAADDNKEGTFPFAFVYNRGENDAWIGYGGAVVYTRDAKLPEVLLPRLREATRKVKFDFDKDFALTDNTCRVMQDDERILLREKFAGKAVIQTEKQLRQQAVLARTAATNTVGGVEKVAEKAVKTIEDKAVGFEKELVTDGTSR
jgi:violaxanthin de-epoxidase